jgi:hypothetical protein
MTRRYPDLLLERYRLRELPAPDHAAIERDIAANPSLRARVEALSASDAEIHEQYGPAVFLRRAVTRPRRQWTRQFLLAGGLAAAAIALLATLPGLPITRPATERSKGSASDRPALAVYRWTAAGSERLADGDVARPGDLLRVGYASGGRSYGVILSIDGKGAVTMHLPPTGEDAAVLGQDKLVLLDASYELDDAPRIERFYLITAARAFKVAPVLAAARDAGASPGTLSLPPGLEQVSFAVQKEARK